MWADCTSFHLDGSAIGHERVTLGFEIVDLAAEDRLDLLSVIEHKGVVLACGDKERLFVLGVRNKSKIVTSRNRLIEPRLVHGVPELARYGPPVRGRIAGIE